MPAPSYFSIFVPMETLRIRIRGLLAAALCLLSCTSGKDRDMFGKLDAVLGDKAVYDSYFRDGVAMLKDVLSEQTDPVNIFNMDMRIADSYHANCLDSSLLYLEKARHAAESCNDPERKALAELKAAVLYVKAGYQVEANDILGRYRVAGVPESLRKEYYSAEHVYWGETMAYSATHESFGERLSQRDRYRELLLSMVPENSREWYDLKREEADAASDGEAMRKYSRAMLDASPENSREYAEAAYYYAQTFEDTDLKAKTEWLIRSAIADVMCSTRDYASLNELSRIIFDSGDIDRSFRYLADHCMVDALSYNGKLRPWQIQTFFPEIENAYQEKQVRQGRHTLWLLICISLLLLITLCLTLFLFRRQQILESMRVKLQESYLEIDSRNRELVNVNRRLVELNGRMQESDKVKQEYITLFLGMVSDNINASRQYRNRVLKCIRQGKAAALTDEIEAGLAADDDIVQFYKMFDQAFINIYPDFVAKFNSLLADGAEIVPRGDDILTPELRIFALIKLGITESSRIASLLHYSANTIYNYRAKIKNRARGSRDNFEEAVRALE